MINNLSLGVIISRFQIDQLHEAHRWLLNTVNNTHSHMLVLLGDRNSPASAVNPLPFLCRKEMVKQQFPKAIVMRLMDHADDAEWSNNVDAIITTIVDGEMLSSATLYCGRDGFKSHYHGKYKCAEVQAGNRFVKHSSTERRRQIVNNPQFDDPAFRQGMIYAMGTLFPRTYLTVDMAILRYIPNIDAPQILLAQREWESRWRFPGGFVESGETFAAAARRETEEETGVWVEDFQFVGDYQIADWRLRDNPKDKHKTVLMAGFHSWGAPRGQDDVARVEWHDVEYFALHPKNIVEEHQEMFITGLIPYLDKLNK